MSLLGKLRLSDETLLLQGEPDEVKAKLRAARDTKLRPAVKPRAEIGASSARTPRRTPSASARRSSADVSVVGKLEKAAARDAPEALDERPRLRPRPPDASQALGAQGRRRPRRLREVRSTHRTGRTLGPGTR
jgi:hypothetical protein